MQKSVIIDVGLVFKYAPKYKYINRQPYNASIWSPKLLPQMKLKCPFDKSWETLEISSSCPCSISWKTSQRFLNESCLSCFWDAGWDVWKMHFRYIHASWGVCFSDQNTRCFAHLTTFVRFLYDVILKGIFLRIIYYWNILRSVEIIWMNSSIVIEAIETVFTLFFLWKKF